MRYERILSRIIFAAVVLVVCAMGKTLRLAAGALMVVGSILLSIQQGIVHRYVPLAVLIFAVIVVLDVVVSKDSKTGARAAVVVFAIVFFGLNMTSLWSKSVYDTLNYPAVLLAQQQISSGKKQIASCGVSADDEGTYIYLLNKTLEDTDIVHMLYEPEHGTDLTVSTAYLNTREVQKNGEHIAYYSVTEKEAYSILSSIQS